MKTSHLLLLSAAALTLAACDQARDAATETAAQVEAAAKKAAAESRETASDLEDEAEAAKPGLKEKAASAMKSVRSAGSEALEKSKDWAGDAVDWTKQKIASPEAQTMIDRFQTLFADAKREINEGLTSEKAADLRAKWDDLYAKTTDGIQNMAPKQQEQVKAVLATLKEKWEAMLAKSEKKAEAAGANDPAE